MYSGTLLKWTSLGPLGVQNIEASVVQRLILPIGMAMHTWAVELVDLEWVIQEVINLSSELPYNVYKKWMMRLHF